VSNTDDLRDWPPDRMTRLLRAKAGELENRVLQEFDKPSTLPAWAAPLETRIIELTADIAMVAHILAAYIERSSAASG
jgi:hypothetical protein